MSETNHPWCRDVRRDEAVRAAEDAAAAERTLLPDHRDLPQAVAELRERVARLEDHFADASKMVTPKPAPPSADGLRTERVTLEIKHFDDNDSDSVRHWNWSEMMSEQGLGINESVRVVEDADAASEEAIAHGATLNALAEARESLAAANRGINRLAAERDAAIRERDQQIVALKSRLAYLESAPAANPGGEARQEPVAWGVRTEWGQFRAGLYASPRAPANLERGDEVVPFYTAPQPPRGWLTEEEHRAVEFAARAMRGHAITGNLKEIAGQLDALLARETPPKVRRPMPWHFHAVESEDEENQTARDRQWEEAIREAGGEVE